MQPASVAEVVGGVVRRPRLEDPVAGIPLGLPRQSRHESVDRLGVLDGADQGTAAGSRYVPPTRGRMPINGFHAPSPDGPGHRGPVPPGQNRHSPAAQGQSPPSGKAHAGYQTQPSKRQVSLDTPEGESPINRKGASLSAGAEIEDNLVTALEWELWVCPVYPSSTLEPWLPKIYGGKLEGLSRGTNPACSKS